MRIQKKLKEAALSLLSDRHIETMTVSEITECAAVSRQAFYQHFSDRDDLIAAAMIDTIQAAVFVSTDTDPARRIHRLVDVAIHSEALCRNLRPSAASERLADYFQALLRDMAEPLAQASAGEHTSACAASAGEKKHALTVFLAGGLGEIIKFAVNCSGRPGDELSVETVHQMVDHCLETLRPHARKNRTIASSSITKGRPVTHT
ncbi:TetR/AcrR family transcriptional regulator [Mycobacteroides chelonae]|uniref:TetR/AcrR family transcriptional regulator n=1 Tax=Mycobacteroides chelonae TaxID=1774 RepID=UPI0008A925B9|nr:TetR/AcrR family transcriptional regulator [Mycobacteroides chelonae]OHU63634.1 hypothetical protein BKG85_08960 [Mycobacteroides chelonae]